VQFRAEGVASISVFLTGQPMSWDWILVEGYRVTRSLHSESIRRIYGGASQGHMTIGVTWPPEGISPDGGRLGLIPATPPSTPPTWRGTKLSWEGGFKVDPWPKIQEFGLVALSRAGYRYHETPIRQMAVETVLELWFPPPHQLRDLLKKYPL
jgi:hypothetical protein